MPRNLCKLDLISQLDGLTEPEEQLIHVNIWRYSAALMSQAEQVSYILPDDVSKGGF
jgi:hypothetical protein